MSQLMMADIGYPGNLEKQQYNLVCNYFWKNAMFVWILYKYALGSEMCVFSLLFLCPLSLSSSLGRAMCAYLPPV